MIFDEHDAKMKQCMNKKFFWWIKKKSRKHSHNTGKGDEKFSAKRNVEKK